MLPYYMTMSILGLMMDSIKNNLNLQCILRES